MLTQAYLSITFINYQKHIWIRKSKGEVITELGTRTKRSPQNSPELELKNRRTVTEPPDAFRSYLISSV